MRVTVDQVTFDEFTEATVAIRRLFYAKQKRAQRRSAAVYVVAAMMGLFMFGGVFGWFIETPNLLVLCPSEVTFEILPKRSFTSPDDLQTARALFASQIITPGAQPAAFPVLPAAPVATAEPDRR